MRLKALLNARCPHCLEGDVFASFLKMNKTCPVCDITFEREDGYFMMAVFIGYVMGTAVALPIIVALYLSHATPLWYILGLGIPLVGLAPVLFRYSRLIWLHLDEVWDPRPK